MPLQIQNGLAPVILSMTILVGACDRPTSDHAGPAIHEVGRVELLESAEHYVARPGGFAVDERGHYFLTDYFQKWIVEFDGEGAFVRRYGAPGSGPGEFAAIGETVLVFDSIVGAQDYRNRVFHFYHRGSGDYLGSRRVQGVATTGKVIGGTAWLTNISTASGLGMSLWPIGSERIDAASGALPPLDANYAPLPVEYVQSEPLRGTYPFAHAAPWADSALVGYAAASPLLVLGSNGTVVDSVTIPAVRRRGIPPGLVDELRGRFDPARLFSRVSGLYALTRSTDGHVVAVHLDPELHSGNRITGRIFVSVLAPDRTRACVDREIHVSDLAQPLVAVRGDSLFVLDQHVTGETSSLTVVRTFRVGTEGCDWISTRTR